MIKPIAAVPAIKPIHMTEVAPAKGNNAGGFAQQLSEALNQVNEMQVKADDMATKLVLGEVEDLHEVTVAMEQAKLSLQLAVQVRNKIVEAYQEIARMQV